MLPQQRLELAVDIAREAGEKIVAARNGQAFNQQLKNGQELVTDVDVAVDTLIGERLEASLPGEQRLSEELAPDREVMSTACATLPFPSPG